MPALAAPMLRAHNLQALWNSHALSKSGSVVKGVDEYSDRSLAMAEGDSETGLAITTVMTAGDNGKNVPVYVVWNQKNNEVLVVGEGAVDEGVMRAYRHSRTIYVDRSDEGAERKVRGALSRLMSGMDTVDEELLKGAFLLRNMLESSNDNNEDTGTEARTPLSELLVRNDVKNILPQYLTNRSTAAPAP
jgi:hypothetical protein